MQVQVDNTQLVVTRVSIVDGKPVKREIRFSAATTNDSGKAGTLSFGARVMLRQELRILRKLPIAIAEARFIALVTNSVPEDEETDAPPSAASN